MKRLLLVLSLALFACATTPKNQTETVYVAEVAFADAISGLGAAKSKIAPPDYAKAKAMVPCAQNVLYAAENAALNGDGTKTTTNLCAFQTALNEIAVIYGGKALTTICPAGQTPPAAVCTGK
jgi:hypothetical protein